LIRLEVEVNITTQIHEENDAQDVMNGSNKS